ncbi:MAG: hypothetical protein NW207_03205 [Cytophagales bacterium]|nr:hypothetical protein [Cytophagales bacterium]
MKNRYPNIIVYKAFYNFIICYILICVQGFTQQLDKETTKDISNKARRGFLSKVETNDATRQIDMYFTVKSKNDMIKFEKYTFDYDLNFVKEDTEELNIEQSRTKYKWLPFKGDCYEVTGLTAEADMLGNATFKKKNVKSCYDWLVLGYYKTVKILEKVKPKSEDGKKMTFKAAYDNEESGEILALVQPKPASYKDYMKAMTQYAILRVNQDVDIVSNEKLELEKLHSHIFTGKIDNAEGQSDWIIVFAPMKAQGMKDILAPNPAEYTYVRVGLDGKIKDKIPFVVKGGTWRINGVYEVNGQVVLYGPCMAKDVEDYFSMSTYNKVADEKTKFKDFMMVGFKEGKSSFVGISSLADFEIKTKKPANASKSSVYDGKRVIIGGLSFASNGDMYIVAQDYKNVSLDVSRPNFVYEDMYTFQFDPMGVLKNAYSIEDNVKRQAVRGGGPEDARHWTAKMSVIEASDKKSMFLAMVSPHHTDQLLESYEWHADGSSTTTYSFIPRFQLRGAKIDVATGNISDVYTYGGNEYFLFEKFPLIYIEGGTKVVALGENKKGKIIWLGKLDPVNVK